MFLTAAVQGQGRLDAPSVAEARMSGIRLFYVTSKADSCALVAGGLERDQCRCVGGGW